MSPLHTGLCGLVFFALYAGTAATTVQGGDAGELMTVAATGGVAHPPGYPLFSWLARLSVLLVPSGTVAWKASLAASACAAGGVAALHRAVWIETEEPLAAWAAALAAGLAPLVWRYATVAEVFTGGVLTAGLVLWVAARVARGWSGPRASFAFGLALATGIANHHTVVLLYPLGLWGLWTLLRGPRPAVTAAAGLAGLAPGFGAYALLMFPGGGWRWGDTATAPGLVDHFLRRDYGTFSLALSDAQVAWWEHPLDWLTRLPGELGLFLAFALVGVAHAARPGERRGFRLAVLLSVIAAGPGFFWRFNLPSEGFWIVVTTRFHLLPNVLLAVLVGLGFTACLRSASAGRMALPLLATAALVSAGLGARTAPHRGWTVLEDFVRNTLAQAPADALIIGNGDSRLFAFLYAQTALGLRPDVTYVEPAMLGYPWYRERVRSQAPHLLPPLDGKVAVPIPLLVERAGERPIYVAFRHFRETEVAAMPAWPVAGWMRLSRPGDGLPSPADAEAGMSAQLEAWTVRSRPQDEHEATATWEYESWDQAALGMQVLADAWDAAGDEASAERWRQAARAWSPWRAPGL